MLTLIIGLIIGLITTTLLKACSLSTTWSVVIGIAIVIAIQVVVSLVIRKKMAVITNEIQETMMQAQNKINRKINHMQQRQMGNAKQAQQMLEKEQSNAVRECLELTKKAEKFFAWNALLKKQINTMRMMLHFQLKEFKKCDELMKKSMIVDARSVAIKAVRMYRNNDETVEKFLSKKCKRFKNDDAVLIYALYSWILVKKERFGEAAALLNKSKGFVENQVLSDNYERLANGKTKHFSNANLGDLWYSLYLEEPKVKQQRVVQRGY